MNGEEADRMLEEVDEVYWRPYLYKGSFTPVRPQFGTGHGYNQKDFLNTECYKSEEECQDICDRIYLFTSQYPIPLIGKVSPHTIWRLYEESRETIKRLKGEE